MKIAKIHHQVKQVDINQAPVNQPMNQNSLTLRSFTELLLPIVGRRWPLAMIATREKTSDFASLLNHLPADIFLLGATLGATLLHSAQSSQGSLVVRRHLCPLRRAPAAQHL
jgi:hypothetical protein